MFATLDVLDFKIEETDPSKPSSDECTWKISGSAIKLCHKNIGISFEDKMRPIQPVPELSKTFQNTSAFSLCGIIALFFFVPTSAFISSNSLISFVVVLAEGSTLSSEASIDCKNDLSLAIVRIIIDFV